MILTTRLERTLYPGQTMPYAYESIYFDQPIREGRALDIFAPAAISRPVALLFIHGGGWRAGSRATYHRLMQAANAHGYLCAATDYRLAGVRIGDQLEDVREGYRLFHDRLRALGRPPAVAIFGSSAGGHLALLAALAKPGTGGAPDDRWPWIAPVGAAVQSAPTTFEPWDEIFPAIWSSMEGIVGVPWESDPEAYRRVSPIHHVSSQSPPVLLLEAANEHMFRREDATAFVAAMRAAGARAELRVYPYAEHGFMYDVTRPVQQRAFADMLTFLASLET